ncbi:MAG: type II toxin-antitoxin system tRNA(fMet)-specific endonuclease VapC [Candidatus Scalindua sp.]
MLDTNICIYIIKKRPESILKRFKKYRNQNVYISVITLAELQYGVERSSSKKFNQKIINDFISHLFVVPWDKESAVQYGKLRNALNEKGTPVGNMDLMIASHALSQDITLVTNNVKEFKRVPNLKYENWV